MQKQKLSEKDVAIISRHFNIAAVIGAALMIAYAIFEDQMGFTTNFADLQVRAAGIMILPIIIQLTVDAQYVGRLIEHFVKWLLGDPD